MGQSKSRPMTHVANSYHEDIQACVKANRSRDSEKEMSSTAKVGGRGLLPASAELVHKKSHKREYVTHDPGFSTIKPGCYLGFAEYGYDGRVLVTIKIGSDTLHSNFPVYNGRNVLVDKDGSLRNVKDNDYWTDTTGERHLAEAPANMEVISLAGGRRKNKNPDKGCPRTPDMRPAASTNFQKLPATYFELATPGLEGQPVDDLEILRRYRNKRRVKKCFGTRGNGVGQMNGPLGICSTATDDIVVADVDNHRIQIFDVNGQVLGVIGNEGRSKRPVHNVTDVCVTPGGRIVAADFGNHRILILDEQGRLVREFGGYGSGYGELNYPSGVATDAKGRIWVGDFGNNRLQIFSENGKFIGKCGSRVLNNPDYLSVTSNGRVAVSDCNRVHVFDSHGGHLFDSGGVGINNPQGIATDQHGNIIVADNLYHRVHVLTSDGEFVSCFGSAGSGPGEIWRPAGVCVLSDGGIAICDSGNNRVQIF